MNTECGLKFALVPNKWAKKKIPQITYIYRTYARTLNRNKKSAKGVGLPETDWTANGKRDGYSLVT